MNFFFVHFGFSSILLDLLEMFAVNKLRFVASSKFSVLAKSSLSSVKFVASHEYIKVMHRPSIALISFTRFQLVGDIGTVGITQHAADALGDVVYVELPSVGSKYTAGSSFGSVESVKAASDVYVPVTGEVVAVNTVSGD